MWTLINQTELGWDWLYSARGHPLLDVHISKIKGWALKFNIRFPTFFIGALNWIGLPGEIAGKLGGDVQRDNAWNQWFKGVVVIKLIGPGVEKGGHLRLANQAEKFIQSNNVLDGYSTFANI